MRSVKFTIPVKLLSLNELQRTHWAVKRKMQEHLAWLVRLETMQTLGTMQLPIPKARVTVTRHGSRFLDTDGAVGSVKPLLDVLQPFSKRHPNGVGIIAGDDPTACDLTVLQAKCSRKEARTDVHIEEVP